MRNYLSFGGGVNSVAMYLLLKDKGVDFEAVFVNHGTDWPETYEYVDMFKKKYPLTIIKPNLVVKNTNEIFQNLYDFCWSRKMVPTFIRRWCTDRFKRQPLIKYQEPPAFVFIGYAFDEAHRAKINSSHGFEYRFPLIESELTRNDCKNLILQHGLPNPMRSGCFICPYQRASQWKELRHKHPDLFCKAEQLEKRNMEYRVSMGKKPLFLSMHNGRLRSIINEDQIQIFKQDEYPPCECML